MDIGSSRSKLVSLAVVVDLSSVILLSSKLPFCLCLTGELSKKLIQCQSFDHVRDIIFIVVLLFCHVFQGASSTGLCYWIDLTATFLEDLLSMERWTNFFLELADVRPRGVPWQST